MITLLPAKAWKSMRCRSTVQGNLDAIVNQAVAVHAASDAGFIEQRGGALFNHPRPDPAEHIVGTALLEHDIGDAVFVQQLAE